MMRIVRHTTSTWTAIAFLMSGAWAAAQDEEIPADLTIATGTVDGAYYAIGEIIKLAMERRGKTTVEVKETAGSIENISLLKQGEADFALIQGALHVGLDDLVALANIDDQYAHVIVLADSPIKSFRDFGGMRVTVGPEDGGTSALANLIFNFCSLEPEPEIINLPWAAIESELDSGEIDGAFLIFSLYAPYIDSMLASGKFRLIPIYESEAVSRYIPGVHADFIPGHS